MNCIYCSISFSKPSRTKFHQNYCNLNPNKIQKKNQYSNPNYIMPHDEKERRSAWARKLNQLPWDDARRKALSESMKKVVSKYPEKYSASNRGRTKVIHKHGTSFHGKWELIFAEWCIENKIEWIRNTKGFEYNWNGKRTYFPDFYLLKNNLYVEVKGYQTERDKAKWSQFPEKLFVVDKYIIKQIENKTFSAGW